MAETFRKYSKKSINTAVSLINARKDFVYAKSGCMLIFALAARRTALYDVAAAWTALLSTSNPDAVSRNERLLQARAEVNREVERNTHTPPKFSKDGKIAVLRISSAAQVHPVIATRWVSGNRLIGQSSPNESQAGHLQSKALEIVMVANSRYLPGMVSFSCRIARCARSRDPPVNIIASLKAISDLSTTDLVARMGENFARGHKEASGGIIPAAEFEELMSLMKVGEKPDTADSKRSKPAVTQKNNLTNYFSKK